MNILYEALRKAGIPLPLSNTETYRMVRWGHNNRYWLKKFDGGYVLGDFVDGLSKYVFEKAYKGQMLAEVQSRMQQARKEAVIDQAKAHEKASVKATEIWSQAAPLLNHPYLAWKRVQSHGLRSDTDGKIIVPAYDENGKIWSLQYIFEIVT